MGMDRYLIKNLTSGRLEIKSIRKTLEPLGVEAMEGQLPEDILYFVGLRWASATRVLEKNELPRQKQLSARQKNARSLDHVPTQ